MKNPTFEDVLGFTKAERRVWQALEDPEQTIAEIATASQLPRMTAHKVVHRLRARGLIARRKFKKRFRYSKQAEQTVLQRLAHAGDVQNSDAGLVTHIGIPRMLKLLEQLAAVPKARWSLVQSKANAAALVRKVPRARIEALNTTIASQQQITDYYIERDVLVDVAQQYTPAERTSWISSLERMSVVYILPANVLTTKADLLLQQGTAYLLDWDQEIAVAISHTETVKLFEDFLDILTTSVPHTTNMQRLIAEIRSQV